MKTKLPLVGLFFASTLAALGAPLTATTAVHSRPDEAAPTLSILKAGSEPVAAADAFATTPAGWMAVELEGPFDGYVKNGDIMKSLDVRIGAPVYLSPKANATELTKIEASDHTKITGLAAKFTQIRLEKKIVGYIRVSGVSSYTPPPAAAAPAPAQAPLVDASPMTPIAYGTTGAGRPAPMVNLGDGGASTLPRLFQGKFVSTRSPFKPRRPYDWALVDDSGARYAYLDISKLLLTEQIQKYIEHVVVVYGAAKPVTGGKDIVIEVESLQLK